MGTRPVSIEVTAGISGLQARMKAASSSVRSFAADAHTSIQKNRADWNDLAGGVGKVGLAALAVAGMAAKGFATFDKSMSKVKATGADAAGAISELRKAAIEAGADTQFSASEAADAITDLAKAGVSAKDILGGGLAGALDLAAAGELEVKEAAEVTATALAQFKLEGTKASHVADLLAAGAGKAMGDVTDLGMALRQGGLVAAQTGLSIEETTAALSAFAQQGLLGSDAGTSLKTMLQRLTPQSAEAQKQFDALGISAYDANGEFVGLASFAGQLQDKMASLAPEARNAAMGVMFGTDAVRAANVLYSEGADGIEKWISTVDDAGFAARQAATLTDNLAGDLERLGGSMETVFIQGGKGVNDWLRGLAQTAEGAVDTIGRIPEPVLSATTRLTAFAGVASIATAATIKGVTAFSDYRAAVDRITASSPRMGRAISGVTKVAKGLGIALAAVQVGAIFGEMSQSGLEKNLATIESMTNSLASLSKGGNLDSLNSQFQKLGDDWTMWGTAEADIDGVGEALLLAGENSKGLLGAWNGLKQGVVGLLGVKSAATLLDAEVGKLDTSLTMLDGEQAAASFRAAFEDAQAAAAAAGQVFTAEDAMRAFPQYRAGLETIATQYGVTITSAEEWVSWMSGEVPPAVKAAAAANGDLVTNLGVVEGALDDAKLSVDDFLDSLFALERGALSVSDAQIRMEASFDAAKDVLWKNAGVTDKMIDKNGKLTKAGEKLVEAYRKSGKALDINSEAGRENQSALNDIADASMSTIEMMIRNGEATDTVEAATKRARKQLIKAAEAFGMEADEARAFADEAGLIPEDIITRIKTELDREGIDEYEKWKPKVKYGVVKTRFEGEYKTATGAIARAGGGAVFGPGTSTSDSIPAMLSDGEHVLSADDVKDFGGHGAVYRMRALAQAGRLPRFASGGAVSLDDQLERLQIRMEIRDLKRDLAEKETYKVGKKKRKRYKLRGLDRDEAKLQLKMAEAELKEFDSRKWTEGVEKLTDLAKDRVSELQSIASSVKSSLGGFDLRSALGGSWAQHQDAAGNTWYAGTQGSASGTTSGAWSKATRVKAFAGKLQQLQRAGMSGAVLHDIASLGVEEGTRAADMYLADTGQIKSMNEAYAEIETWSQAAGQYVTEASYKGGLSAAEAMVSALESKGPAIGATVAQGFATSLGHKLTTSGSLTKRALGGKVSAGEMYRVNELGVEAFVPAVNGFILTADQVERAQASGKGATINVTAINPQAEPISVTVDKALMTAAAIGTL
ncbi:MAG: phage tail tape measure protein [Propionicimonas sp.]